MVDAIKSGLLSSSVTIPSQKISAPPAQGLNFGDFFKADINQFLNKASFVEGMLTDYVGGVGDIEEIAPKLKEFILEFEVKTKIVSSLANILKTLTSMNI